MTRLPQLEAALLEAAEREREASAGQRASAGSSVSRRWNRRGVAVVAGALTLTGVAVAASTGLLSNGAPVPDAPPAKQLPLRPQPGTFGLADVRVADQDGGPPWGMATYRASVQKTNEVVTCVVVGRVQSGKLGVVGRDGVFHDDGQFHVVSPRTLNETVCGRGTGPLGSLGPAIPASGYTGPPGLEIGGCRERVNLDGPTVSPQTRRRLRDVPECPESSLRQVVAGVGGSAARHATVTADGIRRSQALHAADHGAYLFVLRGDASRPTLRLTDTAGRTILQLPR
jgi:hypothetical protein